jgi:hypothetical protein
VGSSRQVTAAGTQEGVAVGGGTALAAAAQAAMCCLMLLQQERLQTLQLKRSCCLMLEVCARPPGRGAA